MALKARLSGYIEYVDHKQNYRAVEEMFMVAATDVSNHSAPNPVWFVSKI